MIVVGLAEAFPGYKEGICETARFCHITGFVQLNSSTVLIVDSCNHCVRLVDRNSKKTLGFAGECTWPGFDSTHLRNPYCVIEDLKRKGQLIATDPDNNALRGINSSTGTINTITSASTVHGSRANLWRFLHNC